MERITVDQTLRTKFGDFQKSLEVCDEAGKVLGHFTPVGTPAPSSNAALDESPTSREDLIAQCQQPVEKSLDEIWQGLKAPGNEP